MSPNNLKSGDNDELEALFNEIAEQRVWDTDTSTAEAPSETAAAPAAPVGESVENTVVESGYNLAMPGAEEAHDVFRRVGSLTRKLHDALRELGYDKNVEEAVSALPDARARLNYIADLTGKAAEKCWRRWRPLKNSMMTWQPAQPNWMPSGTDFTTTK